MSKTCAAALAMLALVEAAPLNPPAPPPLVLPKCEMGLVWPNASENLPMIAGLSADECALIALQNSQWAKTANATCDDKPDCDIIAYSYCEVSAQCGCLAGNDFCLLWDKIGSGPEMCQKDPCFCSQMVVPVGKQPVNPCTKYTCDTGTGQCSEGKTGNYTSNATCATACKVPPPPPPPPLAQNPCIRFGHTIPVGHHVDAMIVQDKDHSINYTWTNMKFGDFGDWVNIFKPGTGTITIWENKAGKRVNPPLYSVDKIPLTPGPLVAVIKVAQSQAPKVVWPPAIPDNIETIAASYVEGAASSKVRLFNLSPDTKVAGMKCDKNGTKELAANVAFSLGSDWYDVPTEMDTFTVSDDLTSKQIGTVKTTPPAAPLGFTNMLLGLQVGSDNPPTPMPRRGAAMGPV